MSSNTLVGLDIGSASIRAVEAAASKDRPTVTNYGQTVLPTGAVAGGVIKDSRAVVAALRQLWAAQEFTSRNVLLGISHQQVIVRELDVAKLPPRELHQALPFLVRDVLPLPVEEVVLDFYPLDDTAGDTVHGLVIAAPKQPVIDTVQAVEAAGLQVVQVDLACFAAMRAAAHLANDTEALIDLGANGTTIVVHTDGTPKIVRTIARGGNEITAHLATNLGLSPADAERLKCRQGLRPTSDGEEDSAADRVEAVGEALRPLISEIRSSLNYYSSANPGAQVKRLALVGGAALLPGLTDELTERLAVPAYLSDPLQRVNQPRKNGKQITPIDVLGRHRSSAAVSIGLTLGAA